MGPEGRPALESSLDDVCLRHVNVGRWHMLGEKLARRDGERMVPMTLARVRLIPEAAATEV